MLFLNEAFAADPGMPSRSEVASWSHWNLWRTRQQPFKELADGSEVVLVHSWPGGGRLAWQIAAADVVSASYASKSDAVKQISSALGLTSRQVQEHEYTARGPDSGFVLVWSYRPVRRLDLPRPSDVRFRPNGWLKEDDPAILQRWGVSKPRPAQGTKRPGRRSPAGQGRLGLPERVAVEEHSMRLATDWCRSKGWRVVEDVSKTSSWDLEARKRRGGRALFVEVKGTTGKRPQVELTAAEVGHAWGHPDDTALVVVTEIVLGRDVSGPVASGGKVQAWCPWSPTESELAVTMYRWRPATTRSRSETMGSQPST